MIIKHKIYILFVIFYAKMEKLSDYLSNRQRKFPPENIDALTQRMLRLDSDTEETVEKKDPAP